jgi:hypothetical protein
MGWIFMDTTTFDRAEFDRVWQRVSAGEAGAVPPANAEVAGTEVAGTEAASAGVAGNARAEGLLPLVPAARSAKAEPGAVLGASENAGDSSVSQAALENTPSEVLGAAKADAEAARLRDFMDRESAAARYYCQIAARCSGELRRVCLALAADCRCTINRLRTKYYIRTGEVYAPASSVAPTCSAAEALRNACLAETELYNDYLAAAETAATPDLADTYSQAACAARRRADSAGRVLACLI